MTTENTDAATRILSKAIRKLAEQLAEADGSIRYEEGKREEAEDELTAVRAKLAGTSKPDKWEVRRGAHFVEWLATPVKTVGQLADERMAELAVERDKRKCAEEGRRLVGDRLIDLEDRVRSALAVLGSDDSAVHRLDGAVVILRGDA